MNTVVQELHRPARKNFKRRRVIIKGIDDLWECDLVQMCQYARQNQGYKYILMIIDTYSKFAWAIPIKDKSGKMVARAMDELLQTGTNRIPKNLQTDHGTEFYNKYFKAVMDRYNIHHYSTFTHLKASIVERLNRTIKSHMWRLFSLNGSYKWLNILPEIIDKYNNTVHRTIKMHPIDVRDNRLLNTVYSHIKMTDHRKRKLHVGDAVRISKYKTTFEKSYQPNWSTEIFTISRVRNTNPRTYILKDYRGNEISGGFYIEELQRTSEPDTFLVERVLRRRGNRVLVKWLGFSEEHNSWIDA